MRLAITVIMVLLLAGSVGAFGVSPSTRTVYFERGLHDFYIDLLNNNRKDMIVQIEFDGDLKEYASIGSNTINVRSDEEIKRVPYTLGLPEKIGPGKNTLKIVATTMEGKGSGDIVINSFLSVAAKLHVMVPYEGKYLEASVRSSDASPGGAVNFTVFLKNFGSEDIDEARVIIEVYDHMQNVVGELETEGTALKIGESKEFTLHWASQKVGLGAYYARARVVYDGQETLVSTKVYIGSPYVEITNISAFQAENSIKFVVGVKSEWNEQLDFVRTRIMVVNKGAIRGDVASSPVGIGPFGEGEITSFMEYDGSLEGGDTLILMLEYANRVRKEEMPLSRILGRWITADKPKEAKSLQKIALVMLISLVIALVLFIHIRRKKLKQKRKVL